MEEQIMISRILIHKLKSALILSFIFFLCFLLLNHSSFDNSCSSSLVRKRSELDLCAGRYIYIHDLPARFNEDLLNNCDHKLPKITPKLDLCYHKANNGFGRCIENSSLNDFSTNSWYETHPFLLDVIFHNRMKNYECLTNDSSIASAIFVPYYAGIEPSVRNANVIDLVKWLTAKSEWKRMWGRDHFLVAGRISRDFLRESGRSSGSKFLLLPESKNMSILSIESSHWKKHFAIPYPTYFHPSLDRELFEWQDKVGGSNRPYLFSFIRTPRSNSINSIRGEVMNQCLASPRLCKLMHCNSFSRNCENPANVMALFRKSVFCLQPPGDSFTRSFIFDSILAGCIPVFFHPDSAYTQYLWHLPKDHARYSVFISARDLMKRRVSINKTLLKVSEEQESEMREEIIKLIPKIIYADPKSGLESVEDAFDITIDRMLERMETSRQAALPDNKMDNSLSIFSRLQHDPKSSVSYSNSCQAKLET
ncbi:hypothetical protein ACFE04_008679 [Oxalis oulophora]